MLLRVEADKDPVLWFYGCIMVHGDYVLFPSDLETTQCQSIVIRDKTPWIINKQQFPGKHQGPVPMKSSKSSLF